MNYYFELSLQKKIEMAEVILKFDSLDEADDIRLALDGWKWKSVVWDIDQYLRNKIKYNEDSLSSETIDELEKVREELSDIISSSQLFLE
jgi:hypothetical protein